MAEVVLTLEAEKYLNSIPGPLKNKFITEMLALEEDTLVGIPLKGKRFKGFFKVRFDFYGVSYRIVYEPVMNEGTVIIHLLGPRENIYDRLGRKKFKKKKG